MPVIEKNFWNVILDPHIIFNVFMGAMIAGIVLTFIMLPFSKKSETPDEKVRERNVMAGAIGAIFIMLLAAVYFFWRLWEFLK